MESHELSKIKIVIIHIHDGQAALSCSVLWWTPVVTQAVPLPGVSVIGNGPSEKIPYP